MAKQGKKPIKTDVATMANPMANAYERSPKPLALPSDKVKSRRQAVAIAINSAKRAKGYK